MKNTQSGFTLLETVLTIVLMVTIGVGFLSLVQKSMLAAVRTREVMTCSRMADTTIIRLKSINFYSLFAADSNSTNYGLWSTYPYKAVLDSIKSTLNAQSFDRFKITVQFLRRDSSDINSNGLTSDLVLYADVNGDNKDDYDPAIRYYDQNGDSDYYDTYTSDGRTVAEQPDTHIKKIKIELYKRGRLMCSQESVISLEQFTGDNQPSSEAVLKILITTPVNSSYVYSRQTGPLQTSQDLTITKSYPSDIFRYRADNSNPLQIIGETDPVATVSLYLNSSGVLATATSDITGVFDTNPSAITTPLVRGTNTLQAKAVKDVYSSPLGRRTFIYDNEVPTISGTVPTGTIYSQSPYVAAVLADTSASTTTTSGICQDVTTMKVNGTQVYFTYNTATGAVVWKDSTTLTSPILPIGTYNVVLEGGDNAGYKVTSSWSFTIDPTGDTDHSAPSIADKKPIGSAASAMPEISAKLFDNQTGIIPNSIQMTLDGTVVVSSATVASAYDPSTDTVSYTPAGSFASGSCHSVTLQGSHWATNPADKITSTDSWTFCVP